MNLSNFLSDVLDAPGESVAIMKPVLLKISPVVIFLVALLYGACNKDEGRSLSGTDTINNILVLSGDRYAVYGFSFEEGRVISNLEPPGPDINIFLQTDAGGNVTGKYLDSDNLVESFSFDGQYLDAGEAGTAFASLLDIGTRTWQQAAWDLEENQVWLFKTIEGNYVKFRTIDIVVDEDREPPFVELTFEWRIQPDGSTSFSE